MPTQSPFHAVFEECPEGGYHAYVPEVPGVHSQGETLEEARENLHDALEMMLDHNRAARPKPSGKVIKEPMALGRGRSCCAI